MRIHNIAAIFVLVTVSACTTRPMTPDEQSAYFQSRYSAWQLQAATMCLGRAQSRTVAPPAQELAKWRTYGEAAYAKYGSDFGASLDQLTTDLAVTQVGRGATFHAKLDRACANVPQAAP